MSTSTARPRYVYRASVLSVYDADTATVSADLGFNIAVRVSVRLVGINARELADPGGKEARDYLAGLIPPGAPVVLDSVGADKYGGRSIGRLILADGRSVADALVAAGYAAPWNGTGPRPVPPWPIPEPNTA